MGCQPSKCTNEVDLKRRSTIVVKPKASITVGQGIGQHRETETRVVFIFGGPGCGKGTVVHNLVSMFNFKFIGAEHVILKNVSEKLRVPDLSTSQLAKVIQERSSELTINWVLSMIQLEVEKHPHRPILVDVVPSSLKFLFKGDFTLKNITAQMEIFESKFPVSLAINLSVHKDKLISNTHKSHVSVKSTQNEDKGKGGLSDEVDTSRTHKRFKKYEESVHDFVEYFRQSDRLLTVDTSCGRPDIVWESIRAYIINTEFAAWQKPVDLVVLFCFSTEEEDKIDKTRYPMKDIKISDLVREPQDLKLSKVLLELAKYIDMQADKEKHFLINLKGISLKEEDLAEISSKTLMFEEIDVGQLDYFIHKLRRRSKRKRSIIRKESQVYKAICSTNNETLLFPNELDSELCHLIAIFLAESRQKGDNC